MQPDLKVPGSEAHTELQVNPPPHTEQRETVSQKLMKQASAWSCWNISIELTVGWVCSSQAQVIDSSSGNIFILPWIVYLQYFFFFLKGLLLHGIFQVSCLNCQISNWSLNRKEKKIKFFFFNFSCLSQVIFPRMSKLEKTLINIAPISCRNCLFWPDKTTFGGKTLISFQHHSLEQQKLCL